MPAFNERFRLTYIAEIFPMKSAVYGVAGVLSLALGLAITGLLLPLGVVISFCSFFLFWQAFRIFSKGEEIYFDGMKRRYKKELKVKTKESVL